MDGRNDVNRGEFTWKISHFTEQDARKLYSETFTVSGCNWRMLLLPRPNRWGYLSLYLDVPDSATLPIGWARKAEFSLSVIDQINRVRSIRKEMQHNFTASVRDWGLSCFIPLTELHGRTAGGFLANNTLVIKAEVRVLTVIRPVDIQPARPTDKFESYFTGLVEFVNAAETNGVNVGSTSCNQDGAFTVAIPSLEEVEKAKQSLKECLSDIFRINLKERLSKALSTLSLARTGLSETRGVDGIGAVAGNFRRYASSPIFVSTGKGPQ